MELQIPLIIKEEYYIKNIYELNTDGFSLKAEKKVNVGIAFKTDSSAKTKTKTNILRKTYHTSREKFDELYGKIEEERFFHALDKKEAIFITKNNKSIINNLIEKGMVYKLNKEFIEEMLERALVNAVDMHKIAMDPTKPSKYLQLYEDSNYNCDHLLHNIIINAIKEIKKEKIFPEKNSENKSMQI